MSDRLTSLFREGKINDIEYQTYLTFTGNEVARSFLNKMLDSIIMEEPVQPTRQLFAWHDGRRSVWRDIRLMLQKVETILENREDDRSNY